MTHELKTLPKFFEEVRQGNKQFEIRHNDRAFKIGDELILKEWDPDKEYSGRELKKIVTYALTGEMWGIKQGFIILGIKNHPAHSMISERISQ